MVLNKLSKKVLKVLLKNYSIYGVNTILMSQIYEDTTVLSPTDFVKNYLHIDEKFFHLDKQLLSFMQEADNFGKDNIIELLEAYYKYVVSVIDILRKGGDSDIVTMYDYYYNIYSVSNKCVL